MSPFFQGFVLLSRETWVTLTLWLLDRHHRSGRPPPSPLPTTRANALETRATRAEGLLEGVEQPTKYMVDAVRSKEAEIESLRGAQRRLLARVESLEQTCRCVRWFVRPFFLFPFVYKTSMRCMRCMRVAQGAVCESTLFFWEVGVFERRAGQAEGGGLLMNMHAMTVDR